MAMVRSVFGICLLTVWCMAVLPALHAGTPAKETADDPSSCPPPEEIIRELDRNLDGTGSWLVREREDIFRFVAWTGASALVGAALLWLMRRRYRSLSRRGRIGLRREVLHALAAPGMALAVLISSFQSSRPLLKSIPRRFCDWDMRLFYAALTLIAAWGIFGVVSVMDRRLRRFAEREDNSLDDLTVGMLGTVFKIAIAATVLLFVGQNIFDLNITALLAGAGVVGLAVALAAKDTISTLSNTAPKTSSA